MEVAMQFGSFASNSKEECLLFINEKAGINPIEIISIIWNKWAFFYLKEGLPYIEIRSYIATDREY